MLSGPIVPSSPRPSRRVLQRYRVIGIAEHVHTGVIENTGTYEDYGWEPFSYTLSIYEREGIPYFGGGRTITEATRYITLTNNGNVIALQAAIRSARRSTGWMAWRRPSGSAPCASPYRELQEEIKKAKASGAVVFSTLAIHESR